MRVLVACEESQAITIQLRKFGHEAYSCDILDCSGGRPEWHIKADVLTQLDAGWDMMIAHPPCTHLSVAGACWFTNGTKPRYLQDEAVEFVRKLMAANIPRICIENPVSVLSTKIRKPDQIIQPYMFGDPVRKTTCLWLKNLPKLVPSNVVEPELVKLKDGTYDTKWHIDTWGLPADERRKARSKTFPGIARAIAIQWGIFK